MTVYWPAEIPSAIMAGSHSPVPIQNVSVFAPEVGPDMAWPRYTGIWQLETFTLQMSRDQLDALFQFRNIACKSGALMFRAPFLDGVWRDWQWAHESPPTPINIRGGGHYFVSMTLKRRSDS